MFVRQVEIRTANQPGQESGLGEREGADVLVKIDRSRLAESIDGKAILLTEIDLVRVKHENLLLGQPVLEDHGEKDFRHFPPDRATRCQKEVSRELHGQRTATLQPLVRAEIGEGGGDNPEENPRRGASKTDGLPWQEWHPPAPWGGLGNEPGDASHGLRQRGS